MKRLSGPRVHGRAPRRLPAAITLAIALAGGGCATIDPIAELTQAATTVTSRSGVETGWHLPWDEDADVWDGSSPLSADAAVRVALQNNRSIRRDVETIVASRANFAQAHLLPNPIVNFSLGFPTDGLGGDPLAASVVQQLAWLWRRPSSIAAADAVLRARVLAVSDAALQLVADVRVGHARVVFAHDVAALQQQNIDLIQQSMDLVDARFAIGEASRLDLNRLELELRNAAITLADQQAELANARRDLLALMGWADHTTDWETTDTAHDTTDRADSISEETLVHLAQTYRLDVAAANAAVEGRAAGVAGADKGRLPDIAVGMGYQQNFANRPGVFPSITVTPKIFDDNSTRAARAASEWEQARIEADRIRQAATAQARRAWVHFNSHRQIVQTFENEIIRLAESNLRLARDSFDAGDGDLTVLLEAQRHLNQAHRELAARQFAVREHVIVMEQSAGGSLQPPVEANASLVVAGTELPLNAALEDSHDPHH